MTDKLKRYWVIEATNLRALIRAVEKEINDGWEPVGGIVVKNPINEYDTSSYFQAIRKGKP